MALIEEFRKAKAKADAYDGLVAIADRLREVVRHVRDEIGEYDHPDDPASITELRHKVRDALR